MSKRQHYAAKIVATLGPASSSLEMLEQMIQAGVNVVRINFSHGQAQQHIEVAKLVRQASVNVGREVAIMADLQGPKIRVSKFVNNKVNLIVGQEFILDAQLDDLGDEKVVGVDYKQLPQDVVAGDILLLNDGLIKLKVNKVQNQKVYTEVIIGGELSNNKGINKQGGGLTAAAITAKDVEDIKTAVELGANYVALSFPKNASDVLMARQLVDIANKANPTKIGIIAKIERSEAVYNLEEILRVSDGVMVARGDLAVEIGNPAVPAAQKHIIKLAQQYKKIVITATQMMESMISNPMPTRAEVSDVANAILDGTDAVMLSGESAVGKYPLETVKEMKRICCACEEDILFKQDSVEYLNYQVHKVDQAVAIATVLAADKLKLKAIIALTTSGASAQWLSRVATHIPIYALTPNLDVQRKMAMYRNVRPILADTTDDKDSAIKLAEQELKQLGIVEVGDLYAITYGDVMGSPGGTNSLTIRIVS